MRNAGIVVLTMLMLGLTVWGSKEVSASASTTGSQVHQTEFLDRFVGKWALSTSVFGDGFLSSTFPGPNTPKSEIKRDGPKVVFNARLQTGEGPYAEAIFEDFQFALEKASVSEYAISVESKTWLDLKQVRLVETNEGKALKGEANVRLKGADAPLTITIQFEEPTGHTWDFTVRRKDGKQRWFKLRFK